MNNLSKLGNWERQKAIYILHQAEQFGLATTQHTQLGVNPHSGNTWVWDEDWLVCLYMPINCELKASDIWVCWTNPESGEEHELQLSEFENILEMNKWVQELEESIYD